MYTCKAKMEWFTFFEVYLERLWIEHLQSFVYAAHERKDSSAAMMCLATWYPTNRVEGVWIKPHHC
jgi:hypothetical protein